MLYPRAPQFTTKHLTNITIRAGNDDYPIPPQIRVMIVHMNDSSTLSLPVVIFAGGHGTRLGDDSMGMPKPLVNVGPYPILVHIMSLYLKAGHNEFIICAGFKATEIKKYFETFHLNLGTPVFQYSKMKMLKGYVETELVDPLQLVNTEFTVTVVDTGLHTLTGGRLKQVQNLLKNRRFLCTYGDGLTSLDVNKVIEFHNSKVAVATLTAFHPPSRFGEVILSEEGNVVSFQEKPLSESYVNGGFFVFENSIFDFLDSTKSIEYGLLSTLAKNNNLSGYKSNAFWQMMDTPREVKILNELFESGAAPWL